MKEAEDRWVAPFASHSGRFPSFLCDRHRVASAFSNCKRDEFRSVRAIGAKRKLLPSSIINWWIDALYPLDRYAMLINPACHFSRDFLARARDSLRRCRKLFITAAFACRFPSPCLKVSWWVQSHTAAEYIFYQISKVNLTFTNVYKWISISVQIQSVLEHYIFNETKVIF